MNGFNKVILAGNLTRDPEIRYTPSGTAICKFGLAVNRKYTQNGEKKEEVVFIDVDSFGKQAETIAQYLKKGRPLLLEGRLKLDQWEKDGKKFSKLGVVLESFTFLDSGNGQTGDAPQRGVSQADLPTGSTPVPGTTIDPVDDVPFAAPPRTFNFERLA